MKYNFEPRLYQNEKKDFGNLAFNVTTAESGGIKSHGSRSMKGMKGVSNLTDTSIYYRSNHFGFNY